MTRSCARSTLPGVAWPEASELADDHVELGAPAGRRADLDLPAEVAREVGERGRGARGRPPSSSSARTIRPLVALLKWLTTLRLPSTSCSTRTVATRGASVGRRPPERGVRRRAQVDQQPVAERLGRPPGRGASRQTPATGPRPGSDASPESRYAGIRSAGADQPEQRRGDREPGRRRRRLAAARERGEVEGVVEHAGVDPVGPGRRRVAQPGVAVDQVGLGAAERRASARRRRGSPRAQVDERVEHPLAGGGEVREAQRRRGRGACRGAGRSCPRSGAAGSARAKARVLAACSTQPSGWRRAEQRVGEGPAAGRRRRAARGDRADPGGAGGRRPSSRPRWTQAAAAAAARARGCPTSTAPTSRSSRSTRPASMDLDQALHIERDGDGYVVHYAIADVAAFVTPGDPVDVEAHRRGETLYGADSKVPLHPQVLSEGAASLLPDQVRPGAAVDDQGRRRPARAPTSRSSGRGCASTAKLDYDGAQKAIDDGTAAESLALLREVGELRLAARGGPRRGLAAAARAGGRRRRRRAGRWSSATLLPVEEWNAQISLLTGIGRGLADGLRPGRAAAHAAAAGPARRPAAAPHREGAGHRVAGRAALPRLHPLARPRPARTTRRWWWPAPGCCAAAGTSASTARCPAEPQHSALASEYAHVTAPLRRLGDRYAGEVCVALCAGTEVPDWVLEQLHELPDDAAGLRPPRRTSTRAAVLDLVEAGVLRDRVGETFAGVVVEVDEKDARRGDVTIQEPAVEARVTSAPPTCRSAPTSRCGSPPPTWPRGRWSSRWSPPSRRVPRPSEHGANSAR